MTKTYLSALFIISASFILAGCTNKTAPENTSETPTVDTQASPSANTDQPAAGDENVAETYTMEEIAKHNQSGDCWLLINDKVYDVSKFESSHPGGEAILQGCGKDATELYDTRPMGSGTPHSDQARDNLNNFYIGDLITSN